MQDQTVVTLCYALFWIVRINGCVRRGREPFLRGPGWFFDVRVAGDFYAGIGGRILRRYWLRMLAPFAVDVPIAWMIFASGWYVMAICSMVAACAIIHVNHLSNVRSAKQRARALGLGEALKPDNAFVLSLKPRRVRDYTIAPLEWGLATCNLLGVVWTAIATARFPEQDPWAAWGLPLFLLYVEIGALFAKRVAVEWSSPAPGSQSADHMEARETLRKYHALTCDLMRTTAAVSLLLWPIKMAIPKETLPLAVGVFVTAGLLCSVVISVWLEVRRKRLTALALRVPPRVLPALDHRGAVSWPLCYEPSSPLAVLAGSRGYSLNLANRQCQVALAYVAGLALLAGMLRVA